VLHYFFLLDTAASKHVEIILTGDGISEEKTESLRISLGGASALTGHRQDARLVRIDAAGPAASFEFGLRPWR
jgi:hypothetical protein